MKNLIFSIIIINILLLLGLFSCKEDAEECLNDCEPCENFTKYSKLPSSDHSDEASIHPCFNPNNANELVFLKMRTYDKGLGRIYSLIKYNLQTKKEDTLLLNCKSYFPPKWGKNNLIAFYDFNFQLNLINADGKNHRIISLKKGGLRYIDWKNDSIIVADFSYNLGVPNFFAELNINTGKLDTTRSNIVTEVNYNSKGEYVYDGYYSLKMNSHGVVSSLIDSTYGWENIRAFRWHPNNTDIYYTTHKTGLLKVNRDTKKIVKIRNACDARFYDQLSISPDGKKIVVQRTDVHQQSNLTPFHDEGIYLMDIDGKNEVKLFQ
jgi:hypothetical protein